MPVPASPLSHGTNEQPGGRELTNESRPMVPVGPRSSIRSWRAHDHLRHHGVRANKSCRFLRARHSGGLRIGLGVVPSGDVRDVTADAPWRVPPNGKRRNTLRLDRRCRDRGASPVSRPTDRRRTRAVSLPLSGCRTQRSYSLLGPKAASTAALTASSASLRCPSTG
jgi:hypothetical protein